jgi:hypothetical protein
MITAVHPWYPITVSTNIRTHLNLAMREFERVELDLIKVRHRWCIPT